jgi:phosphate transport system permease protein
MPQSDDQSFLDLALSQPMPGVVAPPSVPTDDDIPRKVARSFTSADRTYRALAVGAGVVTLVLLVIIGTFLLFRSTDALSYMGLRFITTTKWEPQGAPAEFGILSVLYWTVTIAVIALLIAIPLAIAIALFLTDFAPRALRRPLTAMVDLLAAIPSLIYGLWGLFVLQPLLVPAAEAVSRIATAVPFLRVEGGSYTGSAFIAGTVVSLMVLPITASVVREVFSQTPMGEREAALALGSTRWDMIKTVVFPFGRGGIIGGSMLGLGRALGETIAVALIISPTFEITPRLMQTGANSVAALIALKFGEANGIALSALMAAGLALFVVTLAVNFVASFVVSRSRSGAGVEI